MPPGVPETGARAGEKAAQMPKKAKNAAGSAENRRMGVPKTGANEGEKAAQINKKAKKHHKKHTGRNYKAYEKKRESYSHIGKT